MIEQLTTMIQQKASTEMAAVKIADFDLSQNKISVEQFETVFQTLTNCGAHVLRFRLFGMPTLNDEVMRQFSDYLRLLTTETAPTEVHLSDCAISTEGWTHLMSAIEETELYPLRAR